MPTWAKWGLALGALAIVLYGVREYAQARAEAQRQSVVADSAVRVADSLSLALDTLDAKLDTVQTREAAVRDSLRAALEQALEDEREAETDVAEAGATLDSTLNRLAQAVRPELEPVVAEARTQLDSLQSAHSRLTGSLRLQVGLLARDTASLSRELDVTRETLTGTREALRSTRSALAEMTEARDKWRDAAQPFGLSVSGEVWGLVGLGVGLSSHLLVR